MNEDERCCGTGTCLINAEGVCWCGQKWDGEKMCPSPFEAVPAEVHVPDQGLNDDVKGD